MLFAWNQTFCPPPNFWAGYATACTCNYICTQRFLLFRSCAYLNSLGKVGFQAKIWFQNKCRARPRFGLVISGSGRVQASKWGHFPTLCGYVGRGQTRGDWKDTSSTPPTNNKNILKSFCEVGYANFRPNVFAAGKRISMEILVGVGLHAWCPVALKRFVAFSKNRNVQEKYLSSL